MRKFFAFACVALISAAFVGCAEPGVTPEPAPGTSGTTDGAGEEAMPEAGAGETEAVTETTGDGE